MCVTLLQADVRAAFEGLRSQYLIKQKVSLIPRLPLSLIPRLPLSLIPRFPLSLIPRLPLSLIPRLPLSLIPSLFSVHVAFSVWHPETQGATGVSVL